MSKDSKVALLGADKFILALEHRDRHAGTSGNTCRYVLDLDSGFDLERFKESLAGNPVANWLARFVLSGKVNNSNHWKQGSLVTVSVEEIETDERLPNELLNHKQSCYTAPLFYFHCLKRSDGLFTLVFSWHHLLMDGYGAALFLKNLVNPQEILPTPKVRSPFTFSVFREMVKAKRFISKTAKGNISTLEDSFKENVNQRIEIISFDEKQTEKIEQLARENGARFGASSYFLSCTANTIQRSFSAENTLDGDFWVPVPQDTRKRGATWPVLGNHLSFLFYRIDAQKVRHVNQCVESLNEQMMAQMKDGIPGAYSHLMNYLRRIPSPLYSRLIKGPNGKSLTSFLFTVAAEHPADLKEFYGGKVLNALSIPPNTYPPGLTLAFNRFEGKLQVVALSYEHMCSNQEWEDFLKQLQTTLLNPVE